MTAAVLAYAPSLSRWYRPIAFAATVVLVALGALETAYALAGPPQWSQAIGDDLGVLTSATQRLFAGESWYLPSQLAGPHPHGQTDVLYPPVVAYAFAPFVVLGIAPYVAIAVAVIGAVVVWHRPAPWSWALIALCAVYPTTILKTISGNPSVLVAVAVALATVRPGFGAFVLLKPTFLPFALLGIRTRAYWGVVAILAVASLPFLRETLMYPRVVLDTQAVEGIAYSVHDWPLALIPVLARWASTRSDR